MALNETESRASPDPERDPALDRFYAAAARDEPPAGLDDIIRAAARREVNAGPRPIGAAMRRWRIPVSIAAVLVLGVSVVLLMREEGADQLEKQAQPAAAPPVKDAAESPPPPEPTQQPAAPARREPPRPAAAPSPATPSPRNTPVAEADLKREAQAAPKPPGEAASASQRAPSAPAPVPEPTGPAAGATASQAKRSIATSAPEAAVQEGKRRRDEAEGSVGRPVWSGFEQQPAESWLKRIEELRRAGRQTEADEMLAEFKTRFPGYPIPATTVR